MFQLLQRKIVRQLSVSKWWNVQREQLHLQKRLHRFVLGDRPRILMLARVSFLFIVGNIQIGLAGQFWLDGKPSNGVADLVSFHFQTKIYTSRWFLWDWHWWLRQSPMRTRRMRGRSGLLPLRVRPKQQWTIHWSQMWTNLVQSKTAIWILLLPCVTFWFWEQKKTVFALEGPRTFCLKQPNSGSSVRITKACPSYRKRQ